MEFSKVGVAIAIAVAIGLFSPQKSDTDSDCDSDLLVRRGEGFRFLQLHFFVAADEHSFAGLGAKHLGAANFTLVSFSELTHEFTSCSRQSPVTASLLFFHFHGLATTFHGSVASASHYDLCSAFCAFVALTYLVWHCPFSLLSTVQSLSDRVPPLTFFLAVAGHPFVCRLFHCAMWSFFTPTARSIDPAIFPTPLSPLEGFSHDAKSPDSLT